MYLSTSTSSSIFHSLILCLAALHQAPLTAAKSDPSDDSTAPFSSSFKQPLPPALAAEFTASWVQHKWDENLSNIAAGHLYNSPSQRLVRVDETFTEHLGSSLFDYNNVSAETGLVDNRQWTVSPSVGSEPACFRGFVNPAFPLFERDLLRVGNAVFGGVRRDEFTAGEVVEWNILYQGVIPVTVLVDGDGDDAVVVGYDLFSPNLRTRVITRFFNIVVGELRKELFDFPCG
ncbi:MAG: hypothetical protein M1817_006452 [Caeruleum heppii]|nr:MAG: hypothetical protein M1817_006452 [Caeruleum heppii]